VLADVACLRQMIESYNGGNMAAVIEVPRERTKSYGILDIAEENGKLVKAKGLVEKPAPEDAPSTLSIIGRYILEPQIFDALEKQKKGSGGEIQLTDAMNSLIGSTDFYGYRFDGKRYDCGSREGYIEANIAFSLDRADMKERIKEMLKHYAI
ncbi:MAG: sugar phosphate nucleotidyltransferase, partial [Pseudomonadota bacterium]